MVVSLLPRGESISKNMKIVTKKKQKEIDKIVIKKLRFVARVTLMEIAQETYLKIVL